MSIAPINADEKTIARMFCIPLTALRKARQNKKIPVEDKNIVFTFSHSAKIIYNVEKFKEWFEDNKWVAHIDFNAEIRRVMENVNRDRELQGMKKI